MLVRRRALEPQRRERVEDDRRVRGGEVALAEDRLEQVIGAQRVAEVLARRRLARLEERLAGGAHLGDVSPGERQLGEERLEQLGARPRADSRQEPRLARRRERIADRPDAAETIAPCCSPDSRRTRARTPRAPTPGRGRPSRGRASERRRRRACARRTRTRSSRAGGRPRPRARRTSRAAAGAAAILEDLEDPVEPQGALGLAVVVDDVVDPHGSAPRPRRIEAWARATAVAKTTPSSTTRPGSGAGWLRGKAPRRSTRPRSGSERRARGSERGLRRRGSGRRPSRAEGSRGGSGSRRRGALPRPAGRRSLDRVRRRPRARTPPSRRAEAKGGARSPRAWPDYGRRPGRAQTGARAVARRPLLPVSNRPPRGHPLRAADSRRSVHARPEVSPFLQPRAELALASSRRRRARPVRRAGLRRLRKAVPPLQGPGSPARDRGTRPDRGRGPAPVQHASRGHGRHDVHRSDAQGLARRLHPHDSLPQGKRRQRPQGRDRQADRESTTFG